MSTRDENFKDAHLQKALRHAPDSDIAPSEIKRKTVLDYADKALKLGQKPRHESPDASWFSRLKNSFNRWHLPNWQLTGMGSLAASLLVVVMFWHENPDNPIQVASAPETVQIEAMPESSAEPKLELMPEAKLAQGELANEELAKDSAEAEPQVATAEVAPVAAALESQDKAKVVASAQSTSEEAEMASQPTMNDVPAPSVATSAENDADNKRAKLDEASNPEASNAKAITAPTPAAPVTVQTAPAPMKKMAGAQQSTASAKVDMSSANADGVANEKRRQTTTRVGDDPLAKTIMQMGGKAMAMQDIQAGKLRILEIADYYKGKPSDCEEPYTTESAPRFDTQTAYKIEEIYVCVVLQQLTNEVAQYNQTMREKHMEKK